MVLQKEDLTAGLKKKKKKSGYTVVFQYMRSKISMSELLTVDNKNLINWMIPFHFEWQDNPTCKNGPGNQDICI